MIQNFWAEFRKFLKEFNIVSIAIGFVMAQAVNNLAQSFVKDIFMPLFNPLIPGRSWEEATWNIGFISFAWGSFVSALLHFIILALIVFFVVKKLMKYKPSK